MVLSEVGSSLAHIVYIRPTVFVLGAGLHPALTPERLFAPTPYCVCRFHLSIYGEAVDIAVSNSHNDFGVIL